jgi:hypothetical protein
VVPTRVPKPALPVVSRGRVGGYVPPGINPKATVHLIQPDRRTKPGSGAEADLNVFKACDGMPVTRIVDHLTTRWSAIRYWSRLKVIELRVR